MSLQLKSQQSYSEKMETNVAVKYLEEAFNEESREMTKLNISKFLIPGC